MKTTKEAFDNLSNAMSNLGNAILKSKSFEYFIGISLFCVGLVFLWVAAAFVRLLIEVITRGYNWTL